MKVLITGVAGLFGVHFSKYLLDNGYDVIGLDNLSGGYVEFVDERLLDRRQFHEIDINNNLNDIFNHYKPEVVYHFAAYAAEGLSPFIRNFNYTNNILGSANIINNCINHDVRKIIFTSSMGVYGSKNTAPYTEDQVPCPEDPYGIAKYAIEMDLKAAYNMFGLEYTIIRPHNVVGIYQNVWDKYRNVIGIWIRKVINNEPITVFGDGLQRRAFSDIDYYMKPFESVITNYNGEIFNIGADEDYSLLEIAEMVASISNKLGYNDEIVHLETRDEVKIAYSNHDKAKSWIQFEDKTNIEDLIYKMFKWVEKEPKREVKFIDYEVNKKMYSYWKK